GSYPVGAPPDSEGPPVGVLQQAEVRQGAGAGPGGVAPAAGAPSNGEQRGEGGAMEYGEPHPQGARSDGRGSPDRMQLVHGLRLLGVSPSRSAREQASRDQHLADVRRLHRHRAGGDRLRGRHDADTTGGDRRDGRSAAAGHERRRAGRADRDGGAGEPAVPAQLGARADKSGVQGFLRAEVGWRVGGVGAAERGERDAPTHSRSSGL
ncbi:MAG: Transposase, partial [uncultured Propionibacteriaceae bacterium]